MNRAKLSVLSKYPTIVGTTDSFGYNIMGKTEGKPSVSKKEMVNSCLPHFGQVAIKAMHIKQIRNVE